MCILIINQPLNNIKGGYVMAYDTNESLILLDKNLKRLGSISPNSDKNAFWGESISRQIADDSSSNDSISGLDTFNRTDPNANSKMWGDELTGLTMTQDSPMAKNLVTGNSIARYNEDIGEWEVYRIINTDESIDETTGRHLVTVEGTNLAIWHLGKTIPPKKEIKECTLSQAMDWLLAGSSWNYDNNSESGLLVDMQFDGTSTSQSYLQNVLTYFDCEVQAYVKFDSTGFVVGDLILELTDHLGSDEPTQSVRYGINMRGIHRKTVDTTLVTKLYVYGPDGQTIESVNNGADFIVDEQANQTYNNDPETYLEGAITSQSIKQPAGLLEWGKRQLKLYNHPRVNYEVNVSSDFHPKLGDEIKIVDTEMDPQLTVQARVIQKQESLSNPYSNTVTLGEFATVKVVTPNFIKALQTEYNDHILDLFEKAKKDSTASSISLITPLGRSWYNDNSSKHCIARLFIEGTNVTSYLSKDSFNWQYIQRDGSHNIEWEKAHANDGYSVQIDPGFVGTLLCSINSDYTKNQAEIWIDADQDNITTSQSLPSNSDGQNQHEAGDYWVRKDAQGNVLGSWKFTSGGLWQDCSINEVYGSTLNPDGSFKEVWKSHWNKDTWGDGFWGGVQCINYMQDGNLIGSRSYTGKKSTKNAYGVDVDDTQFVRYNANGDLMDAMIVHGGGHGSSFTYNPNDQMIYTLCQDYATHINYVGAMPYKPNQEVWVNSFVWRCPVPRFVRPVFEFGAADGNDYMLASDIDGNYDVCNLADLKKQSYAPLYSGKLESYGINPVQGGAIDEGTNTLQSNGLRFPFAFFTMGDVNNKDTKQILGVNVITQSQEFVFPFDEQSNIKLDIPIEKGGILEPEGVYYDQSSKSLMIGFNRSVYSDGSQTAKRNISSLYAVPLRLRDDVANMNLPDPTANPKYDLNSINLKVSSFTTDKARYNPGDTVHFYVGTDNNIINTSTLNIRVAIFQGGQFIEGKEVYDTIKPAEQGHFTQVDWQTPNKDFQGYMAYIFVNGSLHEVRAIDVSSDWTVFPRYGTLTTFKPQDQAQNIKRLESMKDNYINSVQFYDAYYLPQNPMPTNDLNASFTQTWSPWLSPEDRTKGVGTIHDAVQAGHNLYNIASMYYNMIYSFIGDPTDQDFLESIGVDPSWILHRADSGEIFSINMAAYEGHPVPEATQTYLDIRNRDVQRWEFERVKPLLEAGFNFDGWHGDTAGENGPMYTVNADGSHSETFWMSDYLGAFATAITQLMAEAGLGDKKLAINAVAGEGQLDTLETYAGSGHPQPWKYSMDRSQAQLQYSETWASTVQDLEKEIKETTHASGKSLIVPCYIEYDNNNKKGQALNEQTALHMDALVYACGGSRLENLNGENLIQGAFFPTQDAYMSDDLKYKWHNYQTFITGYENFLRDGQVDVYETGGGLDAWDSNGNHVNFSTTNSNDEARKNSIFGFARTNGSVETIQLINYLGVNDLDIHGNSGIQNNPNEIDNFWLHYYPDQGFSRGGKNEIQSVTCVSPDGDNANIPQSCKFTWEVDNGGHTYMNIIIPKLVRWDMLILNQTNVHDNDFRNFMRVATQDQQKEVN